MPNHEREAVIDVLVQETESLQEAEPIRLEREFGELRWTARAKETSASIFLQGRYIPGIQALLEFTDNSVGYRNRREVFPTVITVIAERNRINVTDFGGIGADVEDIKRFALVGETEDVGIGYRGAGAKYAVWFLGEDLEINAKKAGEAIEHSVKIAGFGNPHIEYKGMFAIDPSPSIWPLEKGRFEIIVRRLKDPSNLPGGAAMRRAFGEVYRPLLTQREVKAKDIRPLEPRIIVRPDGQVEEVNDRIVLFLATRKKKRQVRPLEIPLLPGHSEDKLEVAKTSRGELIWFWVGEIDVKDRASKAVRPGIRFYYDGRLLNIDYCGFNDKDPKLAGLVGEAHLDNIEGVKAQLTVNKSAGINTESDQWQRVVKTMNRSLASFVQTLQEKPLPLFEEKPKFLNRAFAMARRLTDLSLKNMAREGILISQEDLRILQGETKGQVYTPPRGERESKASKTTRKGTSWQEQKGRTLPPPEADERIQRVRKSFVDGIELGNLEDPAQLSVLLKRSEATGKRERLILVLNATNPIVSAALLQGELAVTQLVGMELSEALAEIYSSRIEDFRRFRREVLHIFGQNLMATPAYRRLEVQAFQEKVKRKKR